jgi:hypothetical protein
MSPPVAIAYAAAGAMRLPTPAQLARLGTVLCLYPSGAGGELGGWLRAQRAEVGVSLNSDGPEECLAFQDSAGHCCWKLCLLPDSDFLAWERLVSRLPTQARAEVDPAAGIGERLLQRLAGRLRSGGWQGSVLRLHALAVGGSAAPHVLAATLAPVSPTGAAAARAIARRAGADATALVDDCCCLRTAGLAARVAPAASDRATRPVRHPSFSPSRPRTHA